MIPKRAYFYWNAETTISKLRWQTFMTFRKLHPDWEMELLVTTSDIEKNWTGSERQDFEESKTLRDANVMLLHHRANLLFGMNFTHINTETKYAPNYMSDLMRWKMIREGGWYFDVDQIFLKPFDDLCDNDFVFGCDKHNYSGVIGASPFNPHVIEMEKRTREKLQKGVTKYCEAGNWLFSDYIKDKTDVYRTPNNFFYPITDSYDVGKIYDGSFEIPSESYALHWFGGHPLSQDFNKQFKDLNGNDTISKYLRTL